MDVSVEHEQHPSKDGVRKVHELRGIEDVMVPTRHWLNIELMINWMTDYFVTHEIANG